MDARLEVCSKATFQTFNEIRAFMQAGLPDWQAGIQSYGADLPVVILDNRSLLEIRGMLVTEGWRLVFSDPTAVVFLDDATAHKLKLPKVTLYSALENDLREVEKRLELIKNNPSLTPEELRRLL
jgi:hypothetical protein